MSPPEIITTEHKQGIGEVVISWALLEKEVFNALTKITGAHRADILIIFC